MNDNFVVPNVAYFLGMREREIMLLRRMRSVLVAWSRIFHKEVKCMLINISWINLFGISRECDHPCISIGI